MSPNVLASGFIAILVFLVLAQAQHDDAEVTFNPSDPPPFREYQSFDGWFVLFLETPFLGRQDFAGSSLSSKFDSFIRTVDMW